MVVIVSSTICSPTQRAPDWWESARFQAVFVAQAGSVKAALSRPAYQRVTPTVRSTLSHLPRGPSRIYGYKFRLTIRA